MVEELSSYTPQDLADLDALMHEMSATSFCNEADYFSDEEYKSLKDDNDEQLKLLTSIIKTTKDNSE